MPVPTAVLDLVSRFEQHLDVYKAGKYNETQLRRDFLDPFFKALGWDMHNEQGYAEAYRDVIHEDEVRVSGALKAPDYGFRVGGTRKFFLEAKKPSVRVKDDIPPAYQLRRYAWSAKLPLSILTDFEEFAVYDCRIKPAPGDAASTARIFYCRFEAYAQHWDWIASVFSRDAILKGSFDKYAITTKSKRGTAEVNEEFLVTIEGWRSDLAKNLALRNPALSQRELNFAVQRIIDRIIFLRICEDRGIENYQRLLKVADGPGIYERLAELFLQADARYNSGLFYFKAEKGRQEALDELTLHLDTDDKLLRDLIRGLYYPESPYEFSVLGADILGQVYEQFLGKVIVLTDGHRARIEDKPEVKKAGGVYYTPTYIVDYIVGQTVGKLIEGKTPRQIATLRVLDPACGSGSFLISAYQFLLDWHLRWYCDNDPETFAKRRAPAIVRSTRGGWHLSISERKRILLAHMFGVDIDTQAVEVTKLSLLLKVLEGDTGQSMQMELIHQRALPDLGNNIKCGNSIIGPDFYDSYESGMFDREGHHRVNIFNWHAEFPAIMKAGGFDAVIGNPPWGQKAIDDNEALKQYVRDNYPSAKGIYDLFRPFVERAVSLTAEGGLFGMVLPDIVLLKNYEETRRFLLEHLSLQTINWWGMAFKSAVIDAATIVGRKSIASANHQVDVSVRDLETPIHHSIPQADFWKNPRLTFNLFLTPERQARLQRLQDCPQLGEYFEVHEGVHSGNIRRELFLADPTDDTCRPLLFGRGEIAPYLLLWEGKYIRLSAIPERKTRQRYANLGRPEWHEREKVLVRRTGDYVLAAVDQQGRYASNNFFLVFPRRPCSLDLDGLCALLNSPLMTWYFRAIEPRQGRVFAELKIKHLNAFPLPLQALTPRACQALNELGAQRRGVVEGGKPSDRQVTNRLAEHLDRRIHAQVLDLFQLDANCESGEFSGEVGEHA